MKKGLYEQIINKEIENIKDENLFMEKVPIDVNKSHRIISKYFSKILDNGLKELEQNKMGVKEQLEFCNELIKKVEDVTDNSLYDSKLISNNAQMLYSVKDKNDKKDYKRTHYSLSEPNIFTGANSEIQLLNELNREINSADEIDLIVSFVKWSGIIRLLDSLKEFTDNGGKLRIITTVYMGATDAKAVKVLSELKNTQIKISYNVLQTRLHVKSYIFKRGTGFSTAYVGSSNISKAALTSGTEWNVKVTEDEVKEVYDKMCYTFDMYWADEEYETFTIDDYYRLEEALMTEYVCKPLGGLDLGTDFDKTIAKYDIKPYPFQERVLESLKTEREVRGNYKNLVVAATGTGKTVMSAFDFRRFLEENQNKKIRFLFVAHRDEILNQSLNCFRKVLNKSDFGEKMDMGIVPKSYDELFVSIQSFNSKKLYEKLPEDYYDYIIVDEFHHAAADSYQRLLGHFKPTILMGLTATPERMDGKDVLCYFNGHITAEIRLPEAINKKLLVPFSYFGVTDDTDLSTVKWVRGKYDTQELSQLYVDNQERVNLIQKSLDKYLNKIDDVKALGFCVSKSHAKFMAEEFNRRGFKSVNLDSDSSKEERIKVQEDLKTGKINFIFVVDLYNEGVDIPEINTILFLRPTESLTVFLQQLGRGLRLCENKDILTVLDYVGLANKQYRFENKYRALLGSNAYSVSVEMLNQFPHLPQGCYIQLEEKAQEYILSNIRSSFNNKKKMIENFEIFENESNGDNSYSAFLNFYNITPSKLYNCNISFTKLENKIKVEDTKMLGLLSRLAQIDSTRWIKKLLELLPLIKVGKLGIKDVTELERRCLLMLYYTLENVKMTDLGYSNVIDFTKELTSSDYYEEIIDLLKFNYDKIDILTHQLTYDGKCPLELHATYSRNQILAAFDVFKEDVFFPVNAGVFYAKDIKTDLFFVTLQKEEKHFRDEINYNDYLKPNQQMHWQSQNTTSPESATGQRYINHKKMGTNILMCVRNNRYDEYGNTSNYLIVGYCDYVSHKGSKPMSFIWDLQEKIPVKYNYMIKKDI